MKCSCPQPQRLTSLSFYKLLSSQTKSFSGIQRKPVILQVSCCLIRCDNLIPNFLPEIRRKMEKFSVQKTRSYEKQSYSIDGTFPARK